jgi:hypothetical protein
MGQDPEAIRRLARDYRVLRGYEQIPLALAWIGLHLFSLLGAFDRDFPGAFRGLIAILVAAVVIVSVYAIKAYYDSRFGVVEPTKRAPPWPLVVGGIVAFIVLQLVSKGLELRVQLGFLAAGIGLAIYALRRFRFEWQKLFPAVFLIGIAVWPPIDVRAADGRLWHNVFVIGFASAWIVMSIRDHRALVRMFERARLEAANGAR